MIYLIHHCYYFCSEVVSIQMMCIIKFIIIIIVVFINSFINVYYYKQSDFSLLDVHHVDDSISIHFKRPLLKARHLPKNYFCAVRAFPCVKSN